MKDLCEAIAAELRRFGMNALRWDSGTDSFGVGIAPGGTPPDEQIFFVFKTGGGWTGEVVDDETVIADLRLQLPHDNDDPHEIAAAILEAIADRARVTTGDMRS